MALDCCASETESGTELRVGVRVVAHGLTGASNMNGCAGAVRCQSGERWGVAFDIHSDNMKASRTQSLSMQPNLLSHEHGSGSSTATPAPASAASGSGRETSLNEAREQLASSVKATTNSSCHSLQSYQITVIDVQEEVITPHPGIGCDKNVSSTHGGN